MMRINLIRQRKARGRGAGSAERALIAMGAAVLLAIGGMVAAYVNAEADLTAAVRANNGIKDQIERLKSEVGDYDKLKTEREALMKQGKTIEALRTGRTGAVYMLRELSEILTPHKGPTFDRITYEDRLRRDPNVGFNAGWDPRRVWLESFEEAQHKVRIRGSARTNEDVAEFLKRLQLSVFFSDVTPESTNQVTDSPAAGGTKHVTFNVTANVEF
jgi:type IV pilus assembly protein PilN